jgi:hypothetical protein
MSLCKLEAIPDVAGDMPCLLPSGKRRNQFDIFGASQRSNEQNAANPLSVMLLAKPKTGKPYPPFAALKIARTLAVATSVSSPQPKWLLPSGVRHST